jgi:hypothetical protein
MIWPAVVLPGPSVDSQAHFKNASCKAGVRLTRLPPDRPPFARPPGAPAVRQAAGQAGTGTPLIATLTTTTGQGAFRRQARATGPMPSGAQPALPSTSISAPSA